MLQTSHAIGLGQRLLPDDGREALLETLGAGERCTLGRQSRY